MVETKLNVNYGDLKEQVADLYLPTGLAHGAVIVIHGGGWFRGDKSKDEDLGVMFANEGYLTVVANYRIGDNGHYPAPLEDMDKLYAWLKASDLKFPHDHIAVFGSSVGGNMSAEMAIKYGLPAVSLSGIFDIAGWLDQHKDVKGSLDHKNNFGGPSAEINQDGKDDPFYKGFVENYFGGRSDQYVAATPSFRVSATTGPMYIANSLNEFVPSSGVLMMATALADKGVPFTVRFVKGTRHAKGYLNDVREEVLNFIARNI